MSQMELLEGENIRLRAIEPEDLELLYRWENHSEWWGFGSTLAPYSRYQLKEYIKRSHCDIYELKQLRLMIEQLADVTTVGSVDLYDFDPYHLHAGVGILVDSDYQQQGIASEALALLERYAFSFCVCICFMPMQTLIMKQVKNSFWARDLLFLVHCMTGRHPKMAFLMFWFCKKSTY